MIETVLISESNEIAYLNCILKNESLLLQSVESVTAEMFGCKQTREIYTVILNLFEQSKQVSKENLYGVLHSENSTYLSVIYKQKVNIEYFNDYLYNLKNKFLLRQYKSLATDTNKLLETNITGEELNEIIQTKIVSINQQTTSEINDFESNLFDIIPNPDTYTPDQKREFFGISSGLRELDKITVGFHNGCYTIIGGRPSSSKTLLVRQILTYNALQGKPVAFFSMDESEAIIKMKIVASITGLDYNHLKKQELNKEEISILKRNIDVFKQLPFFIDTTPNLSIAVLRTKIKKLLYRHPSLCAIAVDYVQQMDGHGNTAHEKLANISKGLKGLAQEFKLPLFVISQLSRNVENRAVEYDEKWTDPPLLSDLRESGALEADMDKGIFLKIEPRKDEFGNFKEKIKTRVFVLKQRDGEAGLFFDTYTVGKIQRIEEIQHTNNLMF